MAENPFAAPAEAAAPSTGLISVEQQRAVAEVQARMIIARANPRDPRRAMDDILQDCTRVSLAEGALYQYARGGTDISGPSIKLAETMARRWGNIASGIKEIGRRDGYSECVAYAWDLETGFYDERQFQVRHWRDRKGGGGYRVTDERDIYEMVANMGQRRKRAVLLTVIPGDVVEAAVAQCEETLHAQADTSPEAIKRLTEAFAQHGVTKDMLEARIQRRLEAIRPAQVVMLRKVWASLNDNMSEIGDWFELALGGSANDQQSPATGNAALRSRLRPAEHATASAAETETGPPAVPAEAPQPRPHPPAADRSREEDPHNNPSPPEGAPTDAEIERSQAMIAAVLGPEEIAKLDEAAPIEIEVLKPKRLHRGGWDWPAYADALIAAAHRTPVDQLGRFRSANSQMIEALRVSDKEQWSRIGQALADYEREGAE